MFRGSVVERIAAVAGLTFREAIRRRVVLAGALMAGAFLTLYGFGLHVGQTAVWQQATDPALGQLVRNALGAQLLYLGLVPASLLVALTSVFASAGTVSGELDSGVIYDALALPLRRAELVVGKALGLGGMIAGFALLMNGAVIGLARWQVGAPVLSSWPVGLAVLVLEPLPLLALAVLGSTRLPTLANGVMCTAAYGVGFIGGLLESIGALFQSATMGDIGIVSSLIMPLDALHRLALAQLLPPGLLFQQNGPPGMGGGSLPSTAMVAYSAGYVVVMLALAIRVFSRRDL